MSPLEVFERAKELHPSLGLTTVYRTLELLTQLGALRVTYMGDANQRFHRNTDGHHDHLVCHVCGDVMEVAKCYLPSILEAIEQDTGFQIDGHFLELYGRCADCKAQG
jgi:Fur family ferric uptake transcriptional regulator